MVKKLLPPIHPGEILKTEFMEEYNLSANKLAELLNVPPNRVTSILHGSRSVTADTACRLAKCFGTSPEFWLNLQTRYELELARYENLPAKIDKEVRQPA